MLNDPVSRENNFDLIRLISAVQVVVWHSFEHLSLSFGFLTNIKNIIKFFPGVPIFFVISGFLIYSSYKRNKSFKKYLKNRVLRMISVFILAQTIISLAYTYKSISNRMLKRNDISYGVYLFHMPIINLTLFLGYSNDPYLFFWVLLATILTAIISWKLVEQPALKLKDSKPGLITRLRS